jgi:phosphatidate cytidylyltransferase
MFFVGARAEIVPLLNSRVDVKISIWQNLMALLFMYSTAAHRENLLISAALLFLFGSSIISMRTSLNGFRKEIAAHSVTMVYLLIPLSCLLYLRSLPYGPSYLFFVLAVTCITDTGAYYGGKTYGKNKMCPTISPNKTWEGAFFGTVTAMISILIVGYIYQNKTGHPYLFSDITGDLPFYGSMSLLAFFTVIMSILGQIGDLCESALKRDANVKDSGSNFSGHGGYLDMIDAALWIAPALVLFLLVFQSDRWISLGVIPGK